MEFRLASSFQVSDRNQIAKLSPGSTLQANVLQQSLFRLPEPCHRRWATSLNLTPSQVLMVIKHSPKGGLTLAGAQVQLSIKVYKHKASLVPSKQTDIQNRHPAAGTGRCLSLLHLLEPAVGKHRAGIPE